MQSSLAATEDADVFTGFGNLPVSLGVWLPLSTTASNAWVDVDESAVNTWTEVV